jgi:hypothetical protein
LLSHATAAHGSVLWRFRRSGSWPQAPCPLTGVSRKGTVDPEDVRNPENPDRRLLR